MTREIKKDNLNTNPYRAKFKNLVLVTFVETESL